MKFKFLKAITLFLVLIMLASLLAACAGRGENQEDGKTDDKGIPTHKIFLLTHGWPSYSDPVPKYRADVQNEINSRISKDLGYKLDITVNSYPDDVYHEKLKLELASGKEYDLVNHGGIDDLREFARNEMIKDIDSYVKKCDNILKWIPENVFAETTIDGKIFAVPNPGWPIFEGLWVRGEWLDKAELKAPTSLTELETVMKAFRDGDFDGNNKADTVPLAGAINVIELKFLGYFTDTPGDFLAKDKTIKPKYYASGFKEYLATLQKWYKEKYVDELLFNGEENGINELYGQNIVGIHCGNAWQREYANMKQIADARPEMKTIWVGYFQKDLKKYMSNSIAPSYFMAPIKGKNTKYAIEFHDWYLTDQEKYDLVKHGILGKTYEVDGQSLGVVKAEASDTVRIPMDLKGLFGIGDNVTLNFKYWDATTPEESKKAYLESTGCDMSKVYTPITLTLGTKLPDDIQIKLTDSTKVVGEYIADIVRGKKDISAYDEMLKAFENAGGLEAYKLYTDAYFKE